MSVIDEILWLLSDSRWHDLKELVENVALSKSKIDAVVDFLGEYDFIQQNTKTKRIRLQPLIHEFINNMQRVEKEEALCH